MGTRRTPGPLVALATGLGICAGLGVATPAYATDRFVLLNGGHDPSGNFSSHLMHLKAVYSALRERDVPAANIVVFNADGDDPAPDESTVDDAGLARELLRGTSAERLAHKLPTRNSTWDGVPMRPATAAALSAWVHSVSAELHPGDTLTLFTTDHGSRDAGLALWHEAMAPEPMVRLLDEVPEGVRVRLAMSQCFSGAFGRALVATDRADRCGVFSVPEDRVAYGCYPLPDDVEEAKVGFAFRFAAESRAAASLAALADTLRLGDDAPDVPLLTSDLFLQGWLSRSAAMSGEGPLAVPPVVMDLTVAFPSLPWPTLLEPSGGRSRFAGALMDARREAAGAREDAGTLAERFESINRGIWERAARRTPRLSELASAARTDEAAERKLLAILEKQARKDGLWPMVAALDDQLQEGIRAEWARGTEEAVMTRAAWAMQRGRALTALSASEDAASARKLQQLLACEAAPLPGTPGVATAPRGPFPLVAAAATRREPTLRLQDCDDEPAGPVLRAAPSGVSLGLLVGDRVVSWGGLPTPDCGALRVASSVQLAPAPGSVVVVRGGWTRELP